MFYGITYEAWWLVITLIMAAVWILYAIAFEERHVPHNPYYDFHHTYWSRRDK